MVWVRPDLEICKEKKEAMVPILRTAAMVLLVVSVVSAALIGWTTRLSALELGDKAPDFNLTATTGGTISLNQFRGKKIVLLEFYGADFAPV